jgi:radical SAM superfamily enzyme YgiQ (UPF0313 family)
MNTDILLVGQPAKDSRSARPQYGIFSIAGSLEAHGYRGKVEVIDGLALSRQYGFVDAIEKIKDVIRQKKPLSIGFGVYEPYTLEEWKMVDTAIEVESNPSFGGIEANLNWKAYAEVGPVVMGEGEETFPELNDALFQERSVQEVKGVAFFDGKKYDMTQRRNPIDINKIPPPAWHLIQDMSIYNFNISVEVDRRCPYNCFFCSHYLIHHDIEKVNQLLDEGKSIPPLSPSFKSLDRIESEMKTAIDLGVKNVFLLGELVLLKKERALGIGDIMAKYLDEWGTHARPDIIVRRKTTLEELVKRKLRWMLVGVESFSQKTLDLYNKNFNVKTNQKALNILRRLDIFTEIGYIPFNYFMDLEDLGDEIKGMYKNFVHFVKDNAYPLNIFNGWIPQRGTPLYRKALKEGLVKEVTNSKGNLEILARYKDPRVHEVENWLVHYMSTYLETTKTLMKKNEDSHGWLDIDTRLKSIPMNVLDIAYVAAKHGIDGKGAIDHYCQKKLKELEEILAMPVIAK